MESANKMLKFSGENKQKERMEIDRDRIGRLPDEVLNHILSFLDTEQVVQTCVLARRWRYLWTSVPNLDFNYTLFYRRRSNEPPTQFMNFVDRVLYHRQNSCIQKFRLEYLFPYDSTSSRVQMFIAYAVRHDVQELDITLFYFQPLELPHCFFTCESLRVLKLKGFFSESIKLPTSLGLPGLKTLHLDSLNFSDENFTEELFSSCPNLETLILVRCSFQHPSVVNISASQLKNLKILHCGTSYSCPHKIKVSTPKLTSFKYQGCYPLDLTLDNLSSLDNAHIDLQEENTYYHGNDEDYAQLMIKILRGISTATTITLSLDTLEWLSDALGLLECQPPPLFKLKHLKLTTWKWQAGTIPIDAMTYLLNDSPSLETLVME